MVGVDEALMDLKRKMSGSGRSETALILAPVGRDAAIAAGHAVRIEDPGADLPRPRLPRPRARRRYRLRAGDRGSAAGAATCDRSPPGSTSSPNGPTFRSSCSPTRAAGWSATPRPRRLLDTLGNVTFLERPFHPTTLVSLARAALRARRRQYDARARLLALQESEDRLTTANETLEARVEERTREHELALAKLHEAQKLETLGQLTGGVAHDFNNLLTPVIGNLDLLRRRLEPERQARTG